MREISKRRSIGEAQNKSKGRNPAALPCLVTADKDELAETEIEHLQGVALEARPGSRKHVL